MPERGTAIVREPANPAIIRVIAPNATDSRRPAPLKTQDFGREDAQIFDVATVSLSKVLSFRKESDGRGAPLPGVAGTLEV